MNRRTLAAVLGGFLAVSSSPAWALQPSFVEVARAGDDGIAFLNVDVPVALSDDGRVAFAVAETFPAKAEGLFTWQAGSLTPVDLATTGRSMVSSVAVNSDGDVAFVSHRKGEGASNFAGVYRTTTKPNDAIGTLREETITNGDSGPKPRFVALSENGTVAYSTIVSGTGAIYRGPINGAQSVLRSGTGAFFNTKQIDVNDEGRVAVQMEHGAPFGGLGRGILVFDTPEQPVLATANAIEQAPVGVQPMPSINASGQVAFSLNFPVTMTFTDPPNTFNGPVIDTVTLTPGVYVTTPTLYGLPRTYTKIADDGGAFKEFDRVQINDAGLVLFEASLDGGGFGIFAGADPVADKVVALGDMVNNTLASFITLGELNNANQFTFISSDFINTDRRVWLATVPEPAGGLAAAGALALLLRRDRRARVN